MISQTLVAHLHNRSSIMVEGNRVSIDILKDRLIRDTLVKSILVYDHPTERRETVGPGMVKVYQANYTELKKIREELAL